MGIGLDNSWKFESRIRQLDIPVFDRIDPNGWVFRVERYFTLNKLTEEEKWDATAVCLDGDSLAWFQWEDC